MDFHYERKLWKDGYKYVACLDEAGRGPLAGPVIAAAVVVRQFPDSKFRIPDLKDSKKLTPKKREELYKFITRNPIIKWGTGKVSEKIIDRINIFKATKLAMTRAINNLKSKVDFIIIDGNFKIGIDIPQKSIIKGDQKVFSCAVASIIAKVKRDKIMEKYHKIYSRYGFNKHKGYPTKYHFKMLRKYGPCKIHRKSFGPVTKCKRK
jgi:ribonuclease HII